MIRRLAILLLVCGGLGFFLEREQSRGTFDEWERSLVKRLRDWDGPSPPTPPVVLVELRRGDLPFESWPPAPLDYALVFENLVRRQPRAVVVQPLLAWPGVESLDAATLAERIALLPRGVLACTLQRGAEGAAGNGTAPLPLALLPGASGDVAQVPAFDALGQVPIDELRGGKALGFTRIEFGEGIAVDEGSVAVPLVARRGSELFPSLVLQSLLSWQQTAAHDVGVQLGRRLAIGPSLAVPVDSRGRQRLVVRLAPPLRRVDAGVLLIDLERDTALMAERSEEVDTLRSMEGALVVVGETGETTPRFPVAGAPDGGWTEGEVVARALTAALGGYHLREPTVRWQWAMWGGVVALGAALLASPRWWLPVFSLGGAAALALGGALAFLHGQWWVPPVPPMALWLAASVVAALLSSPRPPASAAAVAVAHPSPDPAASALAPSNTVPTTAAPPPLLADSESPLDAVSDLEFDALASRLAEDAVVGDREEGEGSGSGTPPPVALTPGDPMPDERPVADLTASKPSKKRSRLGPASGTGDGGPRNQDPGGAEPPSGE